MHVAIHTPPLLLDSATGVSADHRGRVVVTASHGGIYAAYLVARQGVRGAIFNDAGVGLDNGGIAGLAYLDAIELPAAAIGHYSARIGDVADTMLRGIISHANRSARALGVSAGQCCAEAAGLLNAASLSERHVPPARESRVLLDDGKVPVWGLDSASLVRPSDVDAIVVTGSHGGLVGGNRNNALRVDAVGALFHDAGVGIDQAGLGRLAALDHRGIAAAVVDARTARIGDAASIWRTGRLSHVNLTAGQHGVAAGMTAPAFCAAIAVVEYLKRRREP